MPNVAQIFFVSSANVRIRTKSIEYPPWFGSGLVAPKLKRSGLVQV